jgi:HTH-type transcriptional regulator / antitoxin HigA
MMDIRAIKTDADYEWALKEVEQYFDNVPVSNTPEAQRFDVLSTLIANYEARRFEIPNADPIEVLKYAMGNLGKTQADLGHLITRSRATEVLNRKRRLTPRMAKIISDAWHIPITALVGWYEIEDERENTNQQRQHAAVA